MSKPLKALVIDDDDLARCCLSSILKSEGWVMHESRPLEDPFELLSSANWNVVICELAPEKGLRLELFQAFAERSPNTKIILTTSQPTAKAALDVTSCGIYEYLPKPFDEGAIRLLCSRL